MANAKAIKAKMKSIWNIQKITSAMEIVSTVKLQKVKDKADSFKKYMVEFLYILDMINLSNIFWTNQNISWKKELIIAVSTEKWLCWALNSKLFRKMHSELKDRKQDIEIFCVWKKALEFFSRSWYEVIWVENLKDWFTEADLNNLRSMIWKSIDEWKYSNISIYYNYFKNTMSQLPSSLQVFPLERENFDKFAKDIELEFKLDDEYNADIIIEPSEEEFYSFVYKKFISDMIYGVILQNKTWEHASRMIAMKWAKDNSIEIKKKLNISYNKQRQAAVTQEISEIVWAKTAMEG